jgi:hypothetical protein
VAARSDKRVVEEAIAAAIPPGLSGAEQGDAVISAVEAFVFRFIESETEALDLFSFIHTEGDRAHFATSYRGARWQQKMGLVFARPVDHPAHRAQVRAQVVEYGSMAEACLRAILTQNGKDIPPSDFDGIIKKARAAGVLSSDGADAAQRLRLVRNRIHLFLDVAEKPLVAERDARYAYAALVRVLQECRSFYGLPEWEFGRGWPPDDEADA